MWKLAHNAEKRTNENQRQDERRRRHGEECSNPDHGKEERCRNLRKLVDEQARTQSGTSEEGELRRLLCELADGQKKYSGTTKAEGKTDGDQMVPKKGLGKEAGHADGSKGNRIMVGG